MEAPTGHHRLPQPGGRETVERGGEGGHQAGAPGPQHLHLVHHVVQPGARVEELTAQHHQHVLSPAQASHFGPDLEKTSGSECLILDLNLGLNL